MKRLAFLLLSVVLCASLNAQEHLSFKNIPIEGNISDFISKLKVQGFTLEESMSNGAILKGPFVGYDNCTVYVLCSKSSKTVWKVVASLPSQVSWSSTRSRYEDFKETYTKKYGKPSDSYEFFIDPYERGDGYELQAIKLEKGYYTTYWELEAGTIVVEIDALSNSDGWVKLVYEDAAGCAIQEREKSQMISDEI